jgi:hypothetical protein
MIEGEFSFGRTPAREAMAIPKGLLHGGTLIDNRQERGGKAFGDKAANFRNGHGDLPAALRFAADRKNSLQAKDTKGKIGNVREHVDRTGTNRPSASYKSYNMERRVLTCRIHRA